MLLAFFAAFNLLEASLPSWLSKVCPGGQSGTAMGIYSTCQFLAPLLEVRWVAGACSITVSAG